MAEKLKKDELDLETNQDELVIELDEEPKEEQDPDQYEVDDPLNVNISLDDIKDLTEEECDILFVKIEVAVDECENKLELITDSDINSLQENEEEYLKVKEELKRLKNLNNLIHKQKKSLNKNVKEGGLFGNLPVWAFVLFIICALFTIVPINPYFPIELYIDYSEKINSSFINSIQGAFFWYFSYIGIFLIVEIIIFIILLIRGIKSKERMGTFKSYLVMFIINVIIDMPGVILFLNAALRN